MRVPAHDNPMIEPDEAQVWPSGSPGSIVVHPPKKTRPVGFAPWPKKRKKKRRKK